MPAHAAAPRSRHGPARAVLALAATLALVSACGAAPGGGAGATGTAPPASAAPVRIEVTLTDALRIEPATIAVAAGIPVTFVVTNAGSAPHEFVVGDEDAQREHEAEMAEMGGMMHDEEMAIFVDPGATKELTLTFERPGTLLAACHVAGHWSSGMEATIVVE